MEIITLLKSYGLNDKEASLYLAALSAGVASITNLARKSNLKRPTAYLVIDSLLRKNLLISVPKGRKIYYKAEAPEKLQEELDRRQIVVSELLPELKRIYEHASTQPKVRFYEGKDKLRAVYEEIFTYKEIWAMFSVDHFLKVFTEEDNRHFFRILIRHNGKIYDIVEDTRRAKEFVGATYRAGVSEAKFLPKSTAVGADILAYDGKVALVSFENVSCVIIEDGAVAKTMKTVLQLIWDNAGLQT